VEKALTYPLLSDRFNIVAKRYGVSRLPCLYILDSAGNISLVNTGYTEEFSADLLAAVQKGLGVPADKGAVVHAVAAVTTAETVVTRTADEPLAGDDPLNERKATGKRKKGK
jgi:hypothetical protein